MSSKTDVKLEGPRKLVYVSGSYQRSAFDWLPRHWLNPDKPLKSKAAQEAARRV
jgi:hypothetical protein